MRLTLGGQCIGWLLTGPLKGVGLPLDGNGGVGGMRRGQGSQEKTQHMEKVSYSVFLILFFY